MDNPLNHTDEDKLDPHGPEDDLPGELEASNPGSSGVVTTVPDLRPYVYRRPSGRPGEDDTTHPLRRRGDFDPQK